VLADITGGPCKEFSFVLEQFHLHWGEDDSTGSEHLINSSAFPAEVSRVSRLNAVKILYCSVEKQLIWIINLMLIYCIRLRGVMGNSRYVASVTKSWVYRKRR